MSEEFDDFLEKQGEIYRKFKDTSEVKANGVKSHNLAGKGGYLVIFRPQQRIADKVEKFTQRIAQVVPSIPYGAETVHTTISDYKVGENFKPEQVILDGLSRAVHSVHGQLKGVNMGFNRPWLYNAGAVIVPGYPNRAFFDSCQAVINSAGNQGLELRQPWGAHMTTARFTEDVPPKQLEDFFTLMGEAPILGESEPPSIDVGYFQAERNSFTVHTVHEYKFDI
ncbi:MAG: hypothetical protein ACE5ES_02630 [Candidatus Nanoarchaeia archaeon]